MVSFDRILAALESLLSFIFTIRTMAKEAFDTGYKILFDTDVLLIMMRKKVIYVLLIKHKCLICFNIEHIYVCIIV